MKIRSVEARRVDIPISLLRAGHIAAHMVLP